VPTAIENEGRLDMRMGVERFGVPNRCMQAYKKNPLQRRTQLLTVQGLGRGQGVACPIGRLINLTRQARRRHGITLLKGKARKEFLHTAFEVREFTDEQTIKIILEKNLITSPERKKPALGVSYTSHQNCPCRTGLSLGL